MLSIVNLPLLNFQLEFSSKYLFLPLSLPICSLLFLHITYKLHTTEKFLYNSLISPLVQRDHNSSFVILFFTFFFLLLLLLLYFHTFLSSFSFSISVLLILFTSLSLKLPSIEDVHNLKTCFLLYYFLYHFCH